MVAAAVAAAAAAAAAVAADTKDAVTLMPPSRCRTTQLEGRPGPTPVCAQQGALPPALFLR
ncbi:MAG: hypothetical protein ACK4ZJ_18220 [Allorhizobium sp.]